MSGYDDLLADSSRIVQRVAQARSEADARGRLARVNESLEATIGRLSEAEDNNAGNLALRLAFERQLAKFDPNNPLLKDKLLRQRIIEHAQSTLATTDNWDAVRDVGRTFRIPTRD